MTDARPSRRRSSAARLVAGTAACLLLGLALAPGAAADPFTDGQWYVGPFKLEANHQIADGRGVTVAVLDGMFSPTAPSLAGADVTPPPATPCYSESGGHSATGTQPEADHGTAMVAMIAGQGGPNVPVGAAPGAKVLTYTIGFPTADDPLALACYDKPGGTPSLSDDTAADAIRDAVDKGARIISMSYGGRNASVATQIAILYAERKGVVFVGATDDKPGDFSTRVTPPGSFNGVVLVNGIDPDAKLIPNSATGDPDGPLVVASGPGKGVALGGYRAPGQWDAGTSYTGSSPATAFVAGVLAATLSKWPDATGNQLIQSLARNTGGQEHGIDQRALDGYGYGVVSLTSMLAHDPTTYPDENPTLRDGAVPSTTDILGTGVPGTSGSPSTGSSAPASSTAPSSAAPTPQAASDGGSSTGLVVGLAVGAVVVVGVVVLVAVLLARRGRRGGPPPPTPGPPPPAYSGYGT